MCDRINIWKSVCMKGRRVLQVMYVCVCMKSRECESNSVCKEASVCKRVYIQAAKPEWPSVFMKERKWVTKCVCARKEESPWIKYVWQEGRVWQSVMECMFLCLCVCTHVCLCAVCVCVCVCVWMNKSMCMKGRKSVTEPLYKRYQVCVKEIRKKGILNVF